MHEYAIARQLVDQALATARDEKAQSVNSMRIEVGGGHLTPEALTLAVQLLARGTIAEGAEIVVASSNRDEVRLDSIDLA